MQQEVRSLQKNEFKLRNFKIQPLVVGIQSSRNYHVHHKMLFIWPPVPNAIAISNNEGSTATEFKVKFRNHQSNMLKNKRTYELAIHFNNSEHEIS